MNCRRFKIFSFVVVLFFLLFACDLGAANSPRQFAVMNPTLKNHIISAIPDPYISNISSKLKSWLCEQITNKTYGVTLRENGWKFIDVPRPLDKNGKPQGLDHLALKFDEEGRPTFRVVETKYAKSYPGYIKKELARDMVEKGIEDGYVKEARDYGRFNSAGEVKHTLSAPPADAQNILPIDWHATFYTTKNGEYRLYDPKKRYVSSEKVNSRLDYLANKENWKIDESRVVELFNRAGNLLDLSYDVDEYDFNGEK